MKLNEITGKPKAIDEYDLTGTVKHGKFTKDGSNLKISDDFYCYSNDLISLEGCPQKVGAIFSCLNNKLTSLEGCPQEVGGIFICSHNKLTSLKDIHKQLKKMDGIFYAMNNPIKSHILGLLKIPGCKKVLLDNVVVGKIINKYLPLGDLIDCQEELIEAGFPKFAQL